MYGICFHPQRVHKFLEETCKCALTTMRDSSFSDYTAAFDDFKGGEGWNASSSRERGNASACAHEQGWLPSIGTGTESTAPRNAAGEKSEFSEITFMGRFLLLSLNSLKEVMSQRWPPFFCLAIPIHLRCLQILQTVTGFPNMKGKITVPE